MGMSIRDKHLERIFYILEFSIDWDARPFTPNAVNKWKRQTKAGENLTWNEVWQVVTTFPDIAPAGFNEWQIYREEADGSALMIGSIRLFKE